MIVVADTSPINYLVLIGEVRLLPAIFGAVILPRAVFNELQHSKTSPMVRAWVSQPPAWLEIRSVRSNLKTALEGLDGGEREAIQLALELGISTVLMDEAFGRRQAERLCLEVRGTLGVLERGARLGLTNFREALGRLDRTSFRVSPSVYEAFLRRNP